MRDGPDQTIDFDGDGGSLPITLDATQSIAPKALSAPQLSTGNGVSSALHNLPDPLPVQHAVSVKS